MSISPPDIRAGQVFDAIKASDRNCNPAPAYALDHFRCKNGDDPSPGGEIRDDGCGQASTGVVSRMNAARHKRSVSMRKF